MNYNVTISSHGEEKTFTSTDVNHLISILLKQNAVWHEIKMLNFGYHPQMLKSEKDREMLEKKTVLLKEEIEKNTSVPSMKDNKELVKQIIKNINCELDTQLKATRNILIDCINQDYETFLTKEKDNSIFLEPPPQPINIDAFLKIEPEISDPKYFPLSGLIDKSNFRDLNISYQEAIRLPKEPEKKFFHFGLAFEENYKIWEELCNNIFNKKKKELIQQYEQDHKDWLTKKSAYDKEYEYNYRAWENRKQSFSR